MQPGQVFRAWGHILSGYKPFLTIEVTRECPLHCPGCYAYDPQHIGGGVTLRDLSDFKGEALVQGILDVVAEHRPMHLSIVGGDPLVRYREMDAVLPRLLTNGLHVQLVTSAFREIPKHWVSLPKLNIVVSIDGLQPEHDARRKPATYERILKNIDGQYITVHCTITSQMMRREGYLRDFLDYWTPKGIVKRVWMSLYTPQVGEQAEEILNSNQRAMVIEQLLALRAEYPKLEMTEGMIRGFAHPPSSPKDCIFAQATETVSADLKTKITPCQFGGNPDCSQCGCAASMGLAALGEVSLVGRVTTGSVFRLSCRVGKAVNRLKAA